MNKKYLLRISFLFLALLILFLCAESFFRSYERQEVFDNHTTSDFGVATAFRKNIKRDLLFNGFSYQLKTDTNGLRNFKSIRYEKESNVFRIMCIGGSIFAGSGVNNDETFAFYLSKLFKDKLPNTKIEVINAGKNFWELSEAFIYFENEGYKYNPDLVLTYFHRGELATIDFSEYVAEKIKFRRLAKNKVEIEIGKLRFENHLEKSMVSFLRSIQMIPFYDFIFYKSHVIRFLEKYSRNNLVMKVEKHSKNNLKRQFDNLFLKENDLINWKTDYWELNNKTNQHIPAILYSIGIDRFYELVKEKNAKFLFLLIPSREEILKTQRIVEDFKPMQNRIYRNMLWLDLKKGLIQIQNFVDVPLNFPKAIHFTPAGNFAAATLTLNSIIEKGFIPVKQSAEAKINFNVPKWKKNIQTINSRINLTISRFGYDLLIKGILQKNQNKFEQAENYFKLATKNIHTVAKANWHLGRLYFIKQNFTDSIKFIKIALDNGLLHSDEVFTLLAKAYYNSKQIYLAEKFFKKCIKISPNNFRNYVNYAQLLFFSKRFEESLRQYKKADLIIANQTDILLGIGSTSFLLGKTQESLRAFEEVLKFRPNNKRALSSIHKIKSMT